MVDDMKIKVEDERVFPTLGIVAKPGDKVTIPVEVAADAVAETPAEADDTKVGE